MSRSQTIVIPYTRVSTLENILRDLLQEPENKGATIKLVRMIEPGEDHGCPQFGEHLYSEFKALQALTQQYHCRLTIELQPHMVAEPVA